MVIGICDSEDTTRCDKNFLQWLKFHVMESCRVQAWVSTVDRCVQCCYVLKVYHIGATSVCLPCSQADAATRETKAIDSSRQEAFK